MLSQHALLGLLIVHTLCALSLDQLHLFTHLSSQRLHLLLKLPHLGYLSLLVLDLLCEGRGHVLLGLPQHLVHFGSLALLHLDEGVMHEYAGV